MLNDALPQVTFEIGAWAVGDKGEKATPVRKVFKASKANAVQKETVANKGSKETLDLRVLPANAAHRGLRETRVRLVPRATEALLD